MRKPTDINLSPTFALQQDTSVKQPLMPWNRADAKQQAGMEAYHVLSSNKATLKQMGISKPAAALFVNDEARYAFSIFDAEHPQSVVPEDRKVVMTVDPYYL